METALPQTGFVRSKSTQSFREHLQKVVVPRLQDKLQEKNVHALPRIHHVVVAAGVGKHAKENRFVEQVEQGLTLLTGQKPIKTLAKKSIAGFRLREKQVSGIVVTLRGARMHDFLHRLIHITLPRVRDFRGLSAKAIDAQGNMSIGIREAQVFPEVDPQRIETLFGLQVTIVTTAKNRSDARVLLESVGFPLTDDVVTQATIVGPQRKAAKKSS